MGLYVAECKSNDICIDGCLARHQALTSYVFCSDCYASLNDSCLCRNSSGGGRRRVSAFCHVLAFVLLHYEGTVVSVHLAWGGADPAMRHDYCS